MKTKMSNVVYYYYGGSRRTAEEEKEDGEVKADRAKNRPKKNKDYKPDDIGNGDKDFPYRMRWCGC